MFSAKSEEGLVSSQDQSYALYNTVGVIGGGNCGCKGVMQYPSHTS